MTGNQDPGLFVLVFDISKLQWCSHIGSCCGHLLQEAIPAFLSLIPRAQLSLPPQFWTCRCPVQPSVGPALRP